MCLNPRAHYAYGTTVNILRDLRVALEVLTDANTAVLALQEAEIYRRKQGEFARPLAERMAYDPNTSPGMSTN